MKSSTTKPCSAEHSTTQRKLFKICWVSFVEPNDERKLSSIHKSRSTWLPWHFPLLSTLALLIQTECDPITLYFLASRGMPLLSKLAFSSRKVWKDFFRFLHCASRTTSNVEETLGAGRRINIFVWLLIRSSARGFPLISPLVAGLPCIFHAQSIAESMLGVRLRYYITVPNIFS